MIAFLKGRLVEKTPTDIIIDCNGIGYQVHISLHSYSLIKDQEAIQIYTYLQIKEDAHTLYGFIEKIERECSRCSNSKLSITSRIRCSTAMEDNA